jgi:hypothetical protein
MTRGGGFSSSTSSQTGDRRKMRRRLHHRIRQFSQSQDISVEIDEIKLVNGGITFNARAAVVGDAPDMRARFSDGADAPKTYPSHAANAFCLEYLSTNVFSPFSRWSSDLLLSTLSTGCSHRSMFRRDRRRGLKPLAPGCRRIALRTDRRGGSVKSDAHPGTFSGDLRWNSRVRLR